MLRQKQAPPPWSADEGSNAAEERSLWFLRVAIEDFQRVHKDEFRTDHEIAQAFCARWPGYARTYGVHFVENIIRQHWS